LVGHDEVACGGFIGGKGDSAKARSKVGGGEPRWSVRR
jgi:hypothetical protein